MIAELLLVIGIYALGAACVHAACRRREGRSGGSRHYVLHARNEGRRLEWVVRALHWHGLTADRGIRITVIDEGSSDETPELVRLLARTHGIRQEPVLHAAAADREGVRETVRVVLHHPDDWNKLPPLCSWVR